MGQKCPSCMKNKSTDDNTVFLDQLDNNPNNTGSYRNRQYDDMIGHAKSKNENTNYMVETTNLQQEERELSSYQTRLLSKYGYKWLFVGKLKKLLQKEAQNKLEKCINDFTTTTLQKVESSFKSICDDTDKVTPSVNGFVLNCILLLSADQTSFYSGQVNIKKEKHGRGFAMTDDGRKWDGIWKENQFVYGRYIDTEGNLFKGNFVNGKLHGKGKHLNLHKYSYEGDFLNHAKTGMGKEETAEYTYEGYFAEGLKHGSGSKIFKRIGESYSGEFFNDKIKGKGTYNFQSGEKYEGTFDDDQMHGNGVYTWPDGSEYRGDYFRNLKHGKGVFKQINGKIYEGHFVNGKPHGKGVMTNTQGIKGNVEFTEGKLVHNKNKISNRAI